jgi:RNA methyltransferase, TrmH family
LKILTLARDLRRRKARERQQLFVSEGVRAVEELLRASPGMRIEGALVTRDAEASPRVLELCRALEERDVSVSVVSDVEFASAADTESPQGILAIAHVPAHTLEDVTKTGFRRLLVLDAIQDPGNVGTILRTAAALSVTATIALPGTVDLWNAKVVRSGMGAHFHHLTLSSTWDELDSFRAMHHVALWGADAAGEAVETVRAPEHLALVVGNEGSGLTALTRDRVDRVVALPMVSAVDSLNVAVATGIFLYLLRR